MFLLTAIFVAGYVTLVTLADCGQLPEPILWIYDQPHGDTIGHFVLAAVFALLVNAQLRALRVTAARLLVGSLLVAGVFVFEEGSQVFLRERVFAWSDLGASLAGVACGSVLFLRRRK